MTIDIEHNNKYKYNPIYYFDERKYIKSIGLNYNRNNNINIDERDAAFMEHINMPDMNRDNIIIIRNTCCY